MSKFKQKNLYKKSTRKGARSNRKSFIYNKLPYYKSDNCNGIQSTKEHNPSLQPYNEKNSNKIKMKENKNI